MTSPQKTKFETETPDTLVMNGVNGSSQGIKGALKFQANVRVMANGGKTDLDTNQISVTNADSATLLIAIATSFKSFKNVGGDPEALVRTHIAAASKKSFGSLRKDHIAEHQRLFRRAALDLGTSEMAKRPTNERIQNPDKTNDPHLATLYFQFGRYLLICSSRPGCQPANLQGIWNESMNPPWGSKYTDNINTEMNYWPAEVTNLSECHEPLFDLIKDCSHTGALTAKTFYDCPGWVLHHNTDGWRGTAPINHSNHGIWPTGGAWLCQHLWWHYAYTLDKEFLRETAYPIMKSAAEFFADYLIEDPRNDKGWLISGPSNSPENGGLVMGPTMDHQIIRNLFAHCIESARILGVDAEFAERLKTMRAKIAPNGFAEIFFCRIDDKVDATFLCFVQFIIADVCDHDRACTGGFGHLCHQVPDRARPQHQHLLALKILPRP